MKLLTVLSCLASLGLAAQPNQGGSASQACQIIAHKLPGKVAFSYSSAQGNSSNSASLASLYDSTRQSYWDAANSQDYPPCMVFPACASEVSTVVQVIGSFPDLNFALKSGGHNWNRGWSSTGNGILISFRPNLQDVSISKDQKTVDVGPGARWAEVMKKLDTYKKCTVGGRDGSVGVGGYVVLGGLSYLTAQYGFASDGVTNFETVLANGSIVNANATHNSDLYFSLRGGGNNFGIVTKYTLLTHPIGKVWGGRRTYANDKIPQIASAISNYNTNFNSSVTKSAIIPNIFWMNGTSYWAMNFFYDGPSPPDSVFAEFLKIPYTNDTTSVRSYPDLLSMNGEPVTLGRTTNAVMPIANLPHNNMTEYLLWHYQQANNASFLKDTSAKLILFSMALQPIPVTLQKAKAVGSPGALSIDPNGGDKMWIEYSLAWEEDSADSRMSSRLANLVSTAQKYQQTKYAGIKPTKYVSGQLPEVAYNPIFANDAQIGQDVCRSYGQDTYSKLVATSKRYDPSKLFQKRTSGFHLDMD